MTSNLYKTILDNLILIFYDTYSSEIGSLKIPILGAE